jgi:hypothetical protein
VDDEGDLHDLARVRFLGVDRNEGRLEAIGFDDARDLLEGVANNAANAQDSCAGTVFGKSARATQNAMPNV